MSKVLHLPLNEDSGDARDFSGNDNNGTVNGATQGVGGLRGAKCYEFDGTDDYIDCGTDNSINLNTLSVSAWFNAPSGMNVNANIASKQDNDGNENFDGWNLQLNDGNAGSGNHPTGALTANTRANGTSSFVIGNNDLRDDKWHHAVLTRVRDTGVSKLYIDGQLVDSLFGGNTGDITVSDELSIGSRSSSDTFWGGQIQDVRIYDHTLTPLEVQELYKQGSPVTPRLEKGSVGVTSGLVSRYTMDDTEVSGSTLTDVAGSNDGTINGATTGLQGVDGGQSFDFDGTDDFIEIDQQILPDSASGISISAWINLDSTSGLQYIHHQHDNENQNFYDFSVNSGNIRFRYDEVGISGSSLNTNEWIHVMSTWNDSSNDANLYINGVLDTTGTISESIEPFGTVNDVGIGARTPNSDQPFDGTIDEVRIYDRALSQSEINTIYQNFDPYSKSRAPTDPNIVSSGGVARYSMDDADVSGSTLTDTFGTNDGTINGATTGVSGIGGGEAFDFDGVDDDITLPNENTFDYSNLGPFTVSGWVKGTAFNNGALVDKRLAGSFNGWTIRLRDDGRVQIVIHDGTSQALTESDTNINDNKWHHIVAIFDKGNTYGLRMYIDGVEPSYNQQQLPTSIGNIDNGLSVRIGNFQDGSNYFDGQIDEIRIYDRVLTETEVWTLYQQGKRLLPELVEAR